MTTLEMIIWGLIFATACANVAGVIFMIKSGQREHPESDYLVAQADEEDRRAGGGF